MDVNAGYDVDSQKAKDIKSTEQTAWCSTSVLENWVRKDADVNPFVDCFFFFFFFPPNLRLLVLVVIFIVLRV